ncbi:hypothetical protein CCACVL1_26336 [Corchorus capsularis]|uniref:Uncharacterized protein n=1 Tax=Corchorus capsularis TaxID=210143 RepID=A0A1R3GF72_COCAP|nr:hypothetical protein CCACVL1_26336 [Corchorus capsularis]
MTLLSMHAVQNPIIAKLVLAKCMATVEGGPVSKTSFWTTATANRDSDGTGFSGRGPLCANHGLV